jgi:hypothetical protein
MANKAPYEIPSFYVGVIEANSDMSSESVNQFSPVDVVAASGSGVVGPAALATCADGAAALGILQNNPLIAEAGHVMTLGISKARLGGTVSIGNLLMVASAKLVVATGGNFAVAKALMAGVSGDIVSVYLCNYGKQ